MQRRMRCILCPRWFVPRFYRYRGIDRISITCGPRVFKSMGRASSPAESCGVTDGAHCLLSLAGLSEADDGDAADAA